MRRFILKNERLNFNRANDYSNGRTNGISTSNSLFQVISVNSQTGERMWSKRLGWRDYLIGQTDQYVVLNSADNEGHLLTRYKNREKTVF